MDGENKLLKEKIQEEEDKERMLQLNIKDLKREGDNLASEVSRIIYFFTSLIYDLII